MRPYAQTLLQLLNELRHAGYATPELLRVRRAYDLAVDLYACRLQACGKPMVAHGVGTASAVACVRPPARVLAAAAIHNVYSNGDFGPRLAEDLPARRRLVADAVGEDVEALVHRMRTLREEYFPIQSLREHLDDLRTLDREAVAIYLADALELCVDLGLACFGDFAERRRALAESGPGLVELARALDLAPLAERLDEAFRWALAAAPAPWLRTRRLRSFVATPDSYAP